MCHLVFRAGELVGGNMSLLLLNYRVHQATVQRHVKMNQEEIQIKPSNMCFSLNLFYLFSNIINLYYISPF